MRLIKSWTDHTCDKTMSIVASIKWKWLLAYILVTLISIYTEAISVKAMNDSWLVAGAWCLFIELTFPAMVTGGCRSIIYWLDDKKKVRFLIFGIMLLAGSVKMFTVSRSLSASGKDIEVERYYSVPEKEAIDSTFFVDEIASYEKAKQAEIAIKKVELTQERDSEIREISKTKFRKSKGKSYPIYQLNEIDNIVSSYKVKCKADCPSWMSNAIPALISRKKSLIKKKELINKTFNSKIELSKAEIEGKFDKSISSVQLSLANKIGKNNETFESVKTEHSQMVKEKKAFWGNVLLFLLLVQGLYPVFVNFGYYSAGKRIKLEEEESSFVELFSEVKESFRIRLYLLFRRIAVRVSGKDIEIPEKFKINKINKQKTEESSYSNKDISVSSEQTNGQTENKNGQTKAISLCDTSKNGDIPANIIKRVARKYSMFDEDSVCKIYKDLMLINNLENTVRNNFANRKNNDEPTKESEIRTFQRRSIKIELGKHILSTLNVDVRIKDNEISIDGSNRAIKAS